MIKGIIFDLGGTLVQFTGNQETVIREGAEAMAGWYLKKKHIKLHEEALIEAFIDERTAALDASRQTQTTVLAGQCLQQALTKIDAPKQAFALIEAAIKVYFEPEESAWKPFSDTIDALKTLQAKHYRLGLYSNATDDLFVQRLVNQCYLRPYLSPTFSSAAWGWCKPRPEPFLLIADRWQLTPQEIVMVGDTVDADILGAQNVGMPSILISRDGISVQSSNDIQPTFVCDGLLDIAELVERC